MGWFSRRRTPSAPWREDPQPEVPEGRRPLTVAQSDPDEIRNLAMALVLIWGPSRRLPVVDRLRLYVPDLDVQTADTMIADARAAEQIANAYVYEHSDYTGKHIVFAPSAEVDGLVRARFPWVDEENLGHVYSQSCYGAWHG